MTIFTLPSNPSSTGVRAADDLIRGLSRWDIWGRLGWLEIKRRYSRTVIGPFWSAISIGVFVIAVGSVGSGLFGRARGEYMPFLASGMVIWILISTMITESCNLFIGGAALFRHLRFDYSILAYALVWRSFIGFLHNLTVYIVVMLIYAPHTLSAVVLLALPGLFFIAANGVWVALLLGMFCLRFRDVQPLITSILQLALFITPVLWSPDRLPENERLLFVSGNPLYYMVDVVRAPLLGHIPNVSTLFIVLGITIAGWVICYQVFRRFRKRIAYWS